MEGNGDVGATIHWKHDGDTFGNARDYVWNVNGIVDVGIISIDDWSAGWNQNRLHYRSSVAGSDPQVIPFVATKSNNAQVVGTAICRSGARRKLRCGTIDAVQQDNRATEGRPMNDMWVVDFDADGGDSGGPYFTGTPPYGEAATAFGIHSDSEDGWDPNGGLAWYSTVQNVDVKTDWDICLVSSGSCANGW